MLLMRLSRLGTTDHGKHEQWDGRVSSIAIKNSLFDSIHRRLVFFVDMLLSDHLTLEEYQVIYCD